VGSLLGDLEVWDDTPARARPLRRGLVGLCVGLVVGLAVGWAVAPRPVPSAPVVPMPAARPAPQADQGGAVVDQAILAGPMLATGPGKLQEVQPNGISARVISPDTAPVALLPPRRGAPLVALGGDAVVLIDRAGTVSQLSPSDFRARGMAWAGSKLLACGRRPLPLDQGQVADAAGRDQTRNAPALLLDMKGGAPTEVELACPVASSADGEMIAGAGGAQVPYRGTTRGSSVLAGRAGGPLRTLLSRAQLDAATGPGASVGAIAVSPDGERVAVAAGAAGGPWALLLVPVHPAGGPAPAGLPPGSRRIAVAPGYEAAWLGFTGGGEARLAMVAVDRRGGLGDQALASRVGNGYVLGYDPASQVAAVILAGPPLERADGFAFSPDGRVFAVSARRGWTLLRTDQPSERATLPIEGTLLAWPGTNP
jgi:WD40-like Beta Propeller Repeat